MMILKSLPIRKPWIYLGVVLILAAGVGIGGLLSTTAPRQPVYQGRTLSEWLDDYYVDSRENMEDDQPQTKAYFAIRAIGINAFPTLLHWVAHKPSPWREKLRLLTGKLPAAVGNFSLVRNLAWSDRRPYHWHAAFSILGPEAHDVIPDLIRLMHDASSPDHGFYAALALAHIGPLGLGPLMAAANNPNARSRTNAILAIGGMGANALPALPLLVQCRTNTNAAVAACAVRALEEIELVVDHQAGPNRTR